MLSCIAKLSRRSPGFIHMELRSSVLLFAHHRQYHSYPDPEEKPRISTTKSSSAKQIDKSTGIFDIDKKFRLDKPFPGMILGNPITDSTTPNTVSTKLANGLTVATQENLGLMTSFAFVVKTGRYGNK